MSDEATAKPRRTLRKKVLVAFLTMVAISFFVIMPSLAWELHKANQAIHGFCDALIAKQYRSAYDRTSNEFQASVDYREFTKVHTGLIAKMGNLETIEITHSHIEKQKDGWLGTADVVMTFAHGDLQFTYTLKKNSGFWKIYNYREE